MTIRGSSQLMPTTLRRSCRSGSVLVSPLVVVNAGSSWPPSSSRIFLPTCSVSNCVTVRETCSNFRPGFKTAQVSSLGPPLCLVGSGLWVQGRARTRHCSRARSKLIRGSLPPFAIHRIQKCSIEFQWTDVLPPSTPSLGNLKVAARIVIKLKRSLTVQESQVVCLYPPLFLCLCHRVIALVLLPWPTACYRK